MQQRIMAEPKDNHLVWDSIRVLEVVAARIEVILLDTLMSLSAVESVAL